MPPRKQKDNTRLLIFSVAALIGLVLVGAGIFVVKVLLADPSQNRKRKIHMVQLMKPPPPPKIKEKPPEPEIKKKEEIVEPEQEEPEPEEIPDDASDEAPPGEDLGIDADGTAGADGFGLRAKKGGRSLIGGSLGTGGLMAKYGWYTRIIQDEIGKKVREYLEKNGGFPNGQFKTEVRIDLDRDGKVLGFAIVGSSGNDKMDTAVEFSLSGAHISEPPPEGMPKRLKIRIVSHG